MKEKFKVVNTKVISSRKGRKYTTAYGYFFRKQRNQVLAENPDATFSDLSKAISAKWRMLNRMEKQVYRDKVQKTPFSTSYGLFFHDTFKEVKTSNDSATFGQISHIISRKWYDLSSPEKKAYQIRKRNMWETLDY